jgi:Skp family chaperone for outer membrane proteins
LEAAFETHRAITDLKVQQLEDRDAERKRTEEELRNKVAELSAKNAALEERSRQQEKTSDRGWQLWLAALGFGFGLLSLLVTAALQLKK